jgi:serine/threonine-protein kinase
VDNLEEASGVRIGDLLAGKYRIVGILGAGAMGVVVSAHHTQLDTMVAIKLLWSSMLADEEALRRFAREARAAARIGGEHIARVLDVGTLENEAPYMVMEFLDGVDLASWLKTQGALPIEQAVDFLLQACVAVAQAHSAGIIHRDLKPSNLFCIRRADGQYVIKVLDFGISKISGPEASRSDDQRATKSNMVVGSPVYMSPEQMRSSRDVDLRADIWALGVILFQLLTLHVPFEGTTLPEVCAKITLEEPASVRRLRPDVPAGLAAVIRRCLEKNVEKRFQNVAELAQALLEFGSPNATAWVAHISGMVPNVAFEFVQTSAVPPEKRRRSTRLAAALIAFAVTSALAGWLTRTPSSRSVVASPAMSAPAAHTSMAVEAPLPPQAAGYREADEPSAAPTVAHGAPSASPARPRAPQSKPASPRANAELPPPQPSARPRVILDRTDPWLN